MIFSSLFYRAHAIVICGGAGLGADSGIQDYYGDGWAKAHPYFHSLGMNVFTASSEEVIDTSLRLKPSCKQY